MAHYTITGKEITTTGHPSATYYRPDEIAECMEGITEATYKELWGLVALYSQQPDSEQIQDMCPGDMIGRDDLGQFWDKLTEAAQANVTEVLDRVDRELEERYQY